MDFKKDKLTVLHRHTCGQSAFATSNYLHHHFHHISSKKSVLWYSKYAKMRFCPGLRWGLTTLPRPTSRPGRGHHHTPIPFGSPSIFPGWPAWLSGRTPVSGQRSSFAVLRSTCSWRVIIWWTLTKERQAWCNLQVKLCDPCLNVLRLNAV